MSSSPHGQMNVLLSIELINVFIDEWMFLCMNECFYVWINVLSEEWRNEWIFE